MNERWQSVLVANGATVFLLGMLAGFGFGFFILGEIRLWPFPGSMPVDLPGSIRGWRMAHMEGITNGLLLIGVAAAGGRLRLGARGQAAVGWGLLVTAWGNIIASIMGPLFDVRGLAVGMGGAPNTVMYLLFMAGVLGVLVAMVTVVFGALAGLRAPS